MHEPFILARFQWPNPWKCCLKPILVQAKVFTFTLSRSCSGMKVFILYGIRTLYMKKMFFMLEELIITEKEYNIENSSCIEEWQSFELSSTKE